MTRRVRFWQNPNSQWDARAFMPDDVELEHAFHGCPECPLEKGPDDIYNAGKTHRAVCHEHKTSWLLGSNLFDSWKSETEPEQRERYRQIEDYTDLDRAGDDEQTMTPSDRWQKLMDLLTDSLTIDGYAQPYYAEAFFRSWQNCYELPQSQRTGEILEALRACDEPIQDLPPLDGWVS